MAGPSDLDPVPWRSRQQFLEAERTVLLGDGPDGPVVAHVSVMADDIEIASNSPEWVTLREVYEHFRWNSMTSWEQQAAIRPAGQGTVSSASRMDEIAGRLEACLSAIAKASSGSPSDASIHSASRSPSGQDAMTTWDVAELLGCSYTEARERLLDGRIKAVKDGRWLRTRREWVEEYVARNTVQGVQADPDVHSVPVPRRKRPCQFNFKKGDAAYRFLKKLSEE
jgi:excisionase family DNA binding protein